MSPDQRRLLSADELSVAFADLDSATGLIAAYESDDVRQRDVRDQMLAFCDRHEDALFRTCVEGHLTGSAAVVDPASGRVLVLLHTKLDRWLQPGGHADGDGNLVSVALREATEETGIEGLMVDPLVVDVDIHEVCPPAEPPHLHLDVRFLVVAPAGAEPTGNHESRALRWVTEAQLVELDPDDGLVRLIRSALARHAKTPAEGDGMEPAAGGGDQ